jgi:hypothetical protein
MGVDSSRFLITIRRSRTGLGLRSHVIRGPSFSLLRAEPLPQPPADVRACCDRLGLRLHVSAERCPCGRRHADTQSARSHPRCCEADRRRARCSDRCQRSRCALSMGRCFARERLRLLRARLLDLRTAGHCAPTQFVRALRSGASRRAFEDEARRLALLFGARTRRHLHRARAHGACAALRNPSSDRKAGTLVLRGATRGRSSRHPRIVASRAATRSPTFRTR